MDIFGNILNALGAGAGGGGYQIPQVQTPAGQQTHLLNNGLPSGPQSGLSAEGQPTGLWDKVQKGLAGKGNQMSILADTIGQNLNPTGSNVMGGLGTAFAKSDIAGKKMEADKAEYKDLLSNVLEDLKSGSDMNKVGMVRDPTTGEVKVDTQTRIPRKLDEALPQKESSADASSALSKQKAGSMQDMMTMFQ